MQEERALLTPGRGGLIRGRFGQGSSQGDPTAGPAAASSSQVSSHA